MSAAQILNNARKNRVSALYTVAAKNAAAAIKESEKAFVTPLVLVGGSTETNWLPEVKAAA